MYSRKELETNINNGPKTYQGNETSNHRITWNSSIRVSHTNNELL